MPSLLFCSVFLLSLVFVFVGDALAADKEYYVYVACESDDEVAVVRFDEKQASVHKRIPVGVWPVEIEGPHGITISPDGQYWFLSMAHGKPYGHVYKYTTGDDELLGRVELDLFPATMQISNATGLLYVVNFNLHGDHVPSTVSVVDPESLTELERVQTGVMPHGSRLSPDGLRHYSVAMMDGLLYEIDALSFEVVRTLPVGMDGMSGGHHMGGQMHDMQGGPKPPKPTWVFPHPSESFVYVANNGADEVVEVDLRAWKITRRFPTSPGPYNVEVSPDGKYMAVTYKSDASTGIWDLKKGQELAKIANTRKVSHGVVVSSDSRYAFVSVEGKGGEPGAVDIIDLKKKKTAETVDVAKQAGGIAFWKIEGE
ncbi:YncE family protein [bacterium]|nr:YncE family protein [bacterium]